MHAYRPLRISTLLAALIVATAPLGAADPPVVVQDAWIRWLPAGLPAGGYLSLTNRGDHPVELIDASSDAYRSVALHRSESHSGVSRMTTVEHITIPAHATLSFASAGYHLMLMQPTRTLSPGDHVALTLRFAGGQSRTILVELRRPDGGSTGVPGMRAMPGMH